ncbi:hypothetical protein TNCV_5025021 [Trichonephila clavipes]|nr:hypothetical protein TNCV_5025021 [Trichonephila clavipes]
MLVRLSRAPVLSGGLRHKTQLFSCTLYMAASQDPTAHTSQGPQKVQNPAPEVPVFQGAVRCVIIPRVKKHRTGCIPLSPGLPQDFICGLDVKKKKRETGMARKRAENREGSLGFPGSFGVRDVIRRIHLRHPNCNTNPKATVLWYSKEPVLETAELITSRLTGAGSLLPPVYGEAWARGTQPGTPDSTFPGTGRRTTANMRVRLKTSLNIS